MRQVLGEREEEGETGCWGLGEFEETVPIAGPPGLGRKPVPESCLSRHQNHLPSSRPCTCHLVTSVPVIQVETRWLRMARAPRSDRYEPRSTQSHRPISPHGTGHSPSPKKSSWVHFNQNTGDPKASGSCRIVGLIITPRLMTSRPVTHAAPLPKCRYQPQQPTHTPSSRLAVPAPSNAHFPSSRNHFPSKSNHLILPRHPRSSRQARLPLPRETQRWA